MQTDLPKTDDLLRSIIANVTADTEAHDDLLQEAHIHLIHKYRNEPGHARSWYLQSCRFHLQHLVAAGRSLDAKKRSHFRRAIEEEWQAIEAQAMAETGPEPVVQSVSANDIFHQLWVRLDPVQRKVLVLLHDGFGAREIARLVGISHQAVGRHRESIALLAITLGISL